MKKNLAAAAAIVLALGLAGCSVPGGKVADSNAKPAPAPVSEPSQAPEPVEEPAPADDMIAAYGEILTYVDMVSISVSTPAPYTPSESSMGHDLAAAIQFNVTITNGSDVQLQPMAYGTLSSGGAEGSEIFDTANGINGGPSTVILPGQTVTWPVAYSVNDPADLTMQISPSFEYIDAIFTTVQ